MSAGVRIKDKVLLTANPEAISRAFEAEGISIISPVKLTARALVIVTRFTPPCDSKKPCGPYSADIRISDDGLAVRFVGLSPRDYGHLNTHHAGLINEFKEKVDAAWGAYRKLAEAKVED